MTDRGLSLPFAALQRGEGSAFQAYYEAYVGLVLYAARRFGLSKQSTEDIAQEVFLRLHQQAAKIRDEASVKSWLVTTTRNLAIDHLRKAKREGAGAAGDAALAASEAADAEARDAVQRELEVRLVTELIEAVAAEQGGETFRAFYVDGRTARQIADANGEAVSTVTTRLTRLRRRFKERFQTHLAQLTDAAAPRGGPRG